VELYEVNDEEGGRAVSGKGGKGKKINLMECDSYQVNKKWRGRETHISRTPTREDRIMDPQGGETKGSDRQDSTRRQKVRRKSNKRENLV